MSVIGSNVLAGASGQGGGYNLTNSLRFRSSASAYLNRTPASAGNRRTWTWSGWVKRGILGSRHQLFSAAGVSTNTYIEFQSDKIMIEDYSTGANLLLQTTAVQRDPSAWYHFVVAVDTTQATSSNRIKIYINGVQQTAFASSTYPSQNYDTAINSAVVHKIGQFPTNSDFSFDGYMDEINFIDGQALTPSSFGETSTTTGVWIPKKYTGTYGTNGFYLPFTDNSALTTSSNVGLGKDFSGNSNYWTTNNISLTAGSTYDSMTDVPTLTSATTANYAVLNPLDKGTNNTLSNGNLSYAITTSTQGIVRATFGLPSTGKWYCEATKIAAGNLAAGIATRDAAFGNYLGEDVYGWGYFSADGVVYNNNAGIATGATLANGDVLGIAFNSDSGTLQFYKNGTLQTTTTGFTPSTVQYFFAAGSFGGDGDLNFGQQPFAYTPPTGFVRLNTFNLPTPTIGATAATTANKYFDATLYTGNNSTNVITNSGLMQPDLVWIKGRSQSSNNVLQDSVRGVNRYLISNSTGAEGTDGSVTAFNSNGFSLTTDAGVSFNANGTTYVGWQWRASNATAVTNTAGSINSTVSANTTAGFSIVTYTGNGTAGSTVGHGLGVAPKMYIVKNRNSGGTYWGVYHTSIPASQAVYLNVNSAASTNTALWNSTAPTSSVFSVGTSSDSNESGWTYVAYCFAQVAGYSAFGSYTGNGSADGPFVYTGFRPRFILFKATSNVADWGIYDTSRSTYNVVNSQLDPNGSSAEYTAARDTDILSNGFKIRNSNGGMNTNGNTYIYMAFAEVPTKFSLAR
jgi:hypothetical protein